MARKILLVDDDVTPAVGAAAARAQLERELPDIILLDVLMPGEDGFTLADNLAKDERFSEVPVVLVTAVAESTGQMMYAIEHDKGLTATDILKKSEAHERLVPTVDAVLGGA